MIRYSYDISSSLFFPYAQSTDPADKDEWKDRGTGQLSIKCKEGVSKGTRESKPTIVIRNDVSSYHYKEIISFYSLVVYSAFFSLWIFE